MLSVELRVFECEGLEMRRAGHCYFYRDELCSGSENEKLVWLMAGRCRWRGGLGFG